MSEEPADPQPQYHLKYETMTAVFADHVILNGTNGGVVLDFASSIVNDPETGQATIPVHTRVAMTLHGAAQLQQLLANAFNPPQLPAENTSPEPGAG